MRRTGMIGIGALATLVVAASGAQADTAAAKVAMATPGTPKPRAMAAMKAATASSTAHPGPLSAAEIADAKQQVASRFHPTATASPFGTSTMLLDPQHLTSFVGWFRGDILFSQTDAVLNDVAIAGKSGSQVSLQYRSLPANAAYLLDCSLNGAASQPVTVFVDWSQKGDGTPTYEMYLPTPVINDHLLVGFPGVTNIPLVSVDIYLPNDAVFSGCTLHAVP